MCNAEDAAGRPRGLVGEVGDVRYVLMSPRSMILCNACDVRTAREQAATSEEAEEPMRAAIMIRMTKVRRLSGEMARVARRTTGQSVKGIVVGGAVQAETLARWEAGEAAITPAAEVVFRLRVISLLEERTRVVNAADLWWRALHTQWRGGFTFPEAGAEPEVVNLCWVRWGTDRGLAELA